MRFKYLKPVLPALAFPLLATTGLAQQMVGESHPEQLNDGITTPAQTDHYKKPSPAVPYSSTPASTPAQPAYQDSFAATGPVSAVTPAQQPVLVPRNAIAEPSQQTYVTEPVQTAGIVRTPTAQPATDDSGIVLSVPSRPHELHDGTLLHARLREELSTRDTAEGSVFTAELTADAGHSGEVMLPAGSLIRGHVTSVHGGKRLTGGAAMHLRPETISLPDGTLYRLDAQVTDLNSTQDLRVNDEGTIVVRSNPKAAAAVVGAVTGTAAVAGAVVGGGVGAAVGAIAGASIATVVYLKREVQEILPAGTDVIFSLDEALTVTPR